MKLLPLSPHHFTTEIAAVTVSPVMVVVMVTSPATKSSLVRSPVNGWIVTGEAFLPVKLILTHWETPIFPVVLPVVFLRVVFPKFHEIPRNS